MRLFVAISPPPAVLDELDAACAPHRPGRQDLRWTSTSVWHVTLAFLGEMTEAAAGKLTPRLERAARRHQRFSLAFAGAGAFPSAGRANVLWCGLSGDRRALSELAASVSAAGRRAGATLPDAGRGFKPHLTLARCRTPADVRPIVAQLEAYQGQPWTASEIVLIRSYLGGGPPRYQSLGQWPLRTG
jgi:RNA 2',3'-cyclic 3'-phosphodiesterase